MTRKISRMIAAGFFLLSTGFGSTAWAQLAPFPGSKTLLMGKDPVGIGKDGPTPFTFQITLNANNFDATNSVMDVVPAEFDVVGLYPGCGTAAYFEREERRGGGRGEDPIFKLAPDVIVWDLGGCDPTTAQTLTVDIETDLNPGHAKRGIDYYEPTSCGPLFLNDGAVLMRGESDEPSTEPSNALMVASCPDEYDAGCVDADQDGLSVACGDDDDNGDCQPMQEVCDGLDNDCDGMVDEDNPGGGGQCGTTDVGVCEFGSEQCQSEGLVCVGSIDPTTEVCDFIDNDCDGEVDEGCSGGPQ